MSDQSRHHFRYEHAASVVIGYGRHPLSNQRIQAIVNDGHNGSILNCTHPACAALRETPMPLMHKTLDMNLRQFADDLEKGKALLSALKQEYPTIPELVQLLRAAADRLEHRRERLKAIQDALNELDEDENPLWREEG